MVDAVQLLLVDVACTAGAREVDWDYWKEAGKPLAAEQPMLAEERTPEQAVQSNPRYSRSTDLYPVLKTLACTLRAKQYAIRTEHTYVAWFRRFLLYNGKQDLKALEQSDVERFLAYRRICWGPATTSAGYRSCWAVRTYRRR